MELEMEKKVCPCLRQNVRQVLQQEQTLEVRLPDDLPDMGSILCARGQCVLRGKQWRGDGMSATGGVMAWVLYLPADGSAVRWVEAWLPVQLHWDFPESSREGSIRTSWLLKGVDARMLSARKMMVRATVGVLGEALEPWEAELYTPGQTPEDVQLLRRTYPAMVPTEAGEKTFLLDEEFTLPAGSSPVERLIAWEVTPSVSEQRVAGGKAVFRGNVRIHMLCQGSDGQLCPVDLETEFSQFSDLDRDYDGEASLNVMPAVSNVETELQEGRIRLKCALIAQYEVCQRRMLEVAEDAYSHRRRVSTEEKPLLLPMVLDRTGQTLTASATAQVQPGKIVDLTVFQEHPGLRRAGDLTELSCPCSVQMLYYDLTGELCSTLVRCEQVWELNVGEDAEVHAMLTSASRPRAITLGDQVEISAEMAVDADIRTGRGPDILCALELGEEEAPDPGRPSLILCRPGQHSLWELAKLTGSTVDAIRTANALNDEPTDDRLLLIPVS